MKTVISSTTRKIIVSDVSLETLKDKDNNIQWADKNGRIAKCKGCVDSVDIYSDDNDNQHKCVHITLSAPEVRAIYEAVKQAELYREETFWD